METARQYVYLLWCATDAYGETETNLIGVYADYEVAKRVAVEEAKEFCTIGYARTTEINDPSNGTKRFSVVALREICEGDETGIENEYFVEPRLIRRNEMEED